ncbi:MAG: hypothetical protein ACFFAY_12710 [Promethearchaeota archaeon]
MSFSTDYLHDERAREFEPLTALMIPNEAIRLVTETKDGFLVLTTRRLIFLEWRNLKPFIPKTMYWMTRAVPRDCLYNMDRKDNKKWEMHCIKTDTRGNFEGKMAGNEMQYRLETIKLESPSEEKLANFHESMEDLRRQISEMREKMTDPDFAPAANIGYIKELCTIDLDEKWIRKLRDYREPGSVYVVGTGGVCIVGEKQILVGTKLSSKPKGGFYHRLVYKVQKGIVFDNEMFLALVHKWVNFHVYQIEHFWLGELDKTTNQLKTQKDGMPQAKELRIFQIPHDKDVFEGREWLWPNANRAWVLSDAFTFKTGRLLPANLLLTPDEKPRLYY